MSFTEPSRSSCSTNICWIALTCGWVKNGWHRIDHPDSSAPEAALLTLCFNFLVDVKGFFFHVFLQCKIWRLSDFQILKALWISKGNVYKYFRRVSREEFCLLLFFVTKGPCAGTWWVWFIGQGQCDSGKVGTGGSCSLPLCCHYLLWTDQLLPVFRQLLGSFQVFITCGVVR